MKQRNTLSSLLFSDTYEKLWSKTIYKNNLIPTGRFETIIIKRKQDYCLPSSSPYVVQLKSYSSKTLLKDFFYFLPYLKKNEKIDFIERYNSHYIQTNTKEVAKMFNELGFTLKTYRPYPLWKFGGTELLPITGSYTRVCLDEIGQHFRQFYVVIQPGWCSKPHIDNKNVAEQGFKIYLPINVDAYFGYICSDGIKIYKLSKGKAYFCNISIPHFGINPLKEERIALNFQIAADSDNCLLLNGTEIQPEKNDKNIQKQIPWREELYENYDRNYQLLLK